MHRLMSLLALGGVLGCSGALSAKVNFSAEIQPILNEHCVSCHGGVKQAGGISFLSRASLMGEGKSGEIALVPGKAASSEIMRRIKTDDPDERMPPPEEGSGLETDSIEKLESWINEGAEWMLHWAYEPPQRRVAPEVSDPDWVMQPIDAFVLERLDKETLKPSAPGFRSTWLRRASLDLIGLPPSPEEIEDFERNPSPKAYENELERLMRSPRFGERWASMWLDLARYADTQGYEKDLERQVWPWRDWVIRAFNDDMPYDQFLIKQLAGDLLPERTLDDLLATAFHRNTQTNTEGGTDDEEFRLAAVLDRVSATWEALQGTSFRCIQCHSHPYDPFGHDEFYQFFAFFNTSLDADVNEDFPLIKVPKKRSEYAKAHVMDQKLKSIQSALYEQGSKQLFEVNQWVPIKASEAISTGQTQLRIAEISDLSELRAEGNLSTGSEYELVFDVPESLTRLEALRIEALPMDLEVSVSIPEMGFVLSRFKMWVTSNEAEVDQDDKTGIPFRWVVDDDPSPMFDAQDTLKDNGNGWAAYTRLNGPRQAALVPEKPIDLPKGGRIRIKMSFQRSATGSIPLLIRRARFAVSESPEWSHWMDSKMFDSQLENLQRLREEQNKIQGVAVPVMLEQPSDRKRLTEVFLRGNWQDRGKRVNPNVPSILPPLPEGAQVDRLAMAQWMASDQQPLTARVFVNRIWAQLFGAGIVASLEEFGSTGSPPSHPALLDDLSVRFMKDMGWSLKSLLKELVLSATYRQSAVVSSELKEKDPSNRLLARGPRTRLTAEMIRDQALFVSGLLSPKMYGPPVMPPQPEGVWRTVYNSASWKTAEGEDRYRRGLYTYCRRTSGYPSFLAFDAPTREVCSPRRMPTNTPLQALVTLNDPAYMECAQSLAIRMRHDKEAFDPSIAIRNGMRLVTGKTPSNAEMQPLEDLFATAVEHYQKHGELTEALGENAEQAALVLVANALLNLDVILTK